MLYTRKRSEEFDALAEQVITYVEKSGYDEIKADFEGYESPASLTMMSQDITLTPDFTAKRGERKFYFELVIKNPEKEDQIMLISKWKALEMIAKRKGGSLGLFVPRGSFKFATDLVRDNDIDAKLIKLTDIQSN